MVCTFSHPIYDAVRPWLEAERTLAALNRAATVRELRTESGKPVRFVPPGGRRGAYELRAHETGEIETRPDNLHDWFNALSWLAFPRTKARINAMHAAEMPREGGRRSRLRDLLTIFDEGGAIVVCADDALNQRLRELRWKELFWAQRERVRRSMRFRVLGHAVLEQALKPWPGITCKALFARPDEDADHAAAAWLASRGEDASPRDLAALPVFGYPGWAENHRAEFYDDERYFRDTKRGGAA